VAPHSTIWDIYLFVVLDLPCTVSAKENLHLPIFGRFFRAMQPIVVERETNKKDNVVKEIRMRSDPFNSWPQLFVFPEGIFFFQPYVSLFSFDFVIVAYSNFGHPI
jgi:1-acyl-sn-glycerol-3-phosphate acyltransferase